MSDFRNIYPEEMHKKSTDTVFRVGRAADRYSSSINSLVGHLLKEPQETLPNFKVYRRRWNEQRLSFFNSTYYDYPDAEDKELSKDVRRQIRKIIKFLLRDKNIIEVQEYLKLTADKAKTVKLIKEWLNISHLKALKKKLDQENSCFYNRAWYFLLKFFMLFPQDGGIPKNIAKLELDENYKTNFKFDEAPGSGAYIVHTLENSDKNKLPNLDIWHMSNPDPNTVKTIHLSENKKGGIPQFEFVYPGTDNLLFDDLPLKECYESLVSIFQEDGRGEAKEHWENYVWLCMPLYDINHFRVSAGSLQGMLFQILQYPEVVGRESEFKLKSDPYNLVQDPNFGNYVKACIAHSDEVAKELIDISIEEVLRQPPQIEGEENPAIFHLEEYIHLLGDYELSLEFQDNAISVSLAERAFDTITKPVHSSNKNEIYIISNENITQENEDLAEIFKNKMEARLRSLYSRINEQLRLIEIEKRRSFSLTTHSLKTQLKNTIRGEKNRFKIKLENSSPKLAKEFKKLDNEIEVLWKLASLVSLIDKIDSRQAFCENGIESGLLSNEPCSLKLAEYVKYFNHINKETPQINIKGKGGNDNFVIPIFNKYLSETLIKLFFNTLFENVAQHSKRINGEVNIIVDKRKDVWIFKNQMKSEQIKLDKTKLKGNLELFQILIENTASGIMNVEPQNHCFKVKVKLNKYEQDKRILDRR